LKIIIFRICFIIVIWQNGLQRFFGYNIKPNKINYVENDEEYVISHYDEYIKCTIIVNKENKNIKVIKDDYCTNCKSTVDKLIKTEYYYVCKKM